MNRKSSHHPKNCWVYAESYKGDKELPDSRIIIAQHIGWANGWGNDKTVWQTPEPDNYNLAVFGKLPLDCPFVENQVFFYNKKFLGWFSMCCEQDKQLIADYIAWAKRQIIIA
jgi:hypothetical protein